MIEPTPDQPSATDAARTRLIEVLVRTGDEDRAAFRELYTLTSAKLFGVCLRICGERQAAEDVLHDVYLTIWKRAAAYEPNRASPIIWLATIARNRAIDWRRAQAIRRLTPIDAALPIADQEVNRLDRCLDRLAARQRSAIHTAFFDGMSYADLADRADVPLDVMKSWVRRGLMKLGECLEK